MNVHTFNHSSRAQGINYRLTRAWSVRFQEFAMFTQLCFEYADDRRASQLHMISSINGLVSVCVLLVVRGLAYRRPHTKNCIYFARFVTYIYGFTFKKIECFLVSILQNTVKDHVLFWASKHTLK